MTAMDGLLHRWADEAKQLRERYALESAARVCEAHVRELAKVVAAQEDEVLTVPEAAQETGYSAQHLRALVSSGTVPNAGRKGQPRIRRGDLPARKLKTAASRKKKPSPKGREATGRRGFDARRLVLRS